MAWGACVAGGCACVAGGCAWQWACVAGGRAWQEKRQLQWAVRILLECILVNIAVNDIGDFQIW